MGADKRVAVACASGRVVEDLIRCRHFAVVDVSGLQSGPILWETPPPDAPDQWPTWLADLGVDMVFAGRISRGMLSLLHDAGIGHGTVSPGVAPEEVIERYFEQFVAGGQ